MAVGEACRQYPDLLQVLEEGPLISGLPAEFLRPEYPTMRQITSKVGFTGITHVSFIYGLRTVKFLGWKYPLRSCKYFATVIAAYISLSIFQIGSRSFFFLGSIAWCKPIRTELALQQWLSPCLPDKKKKIAFTDATVLSTAFWLLCEDFHDRSTDCKSYISVSRKLGNGLANELVFKLSTERF